MINSIGSGAAFTPQKTEYNLSKEQQDILSETLSNFDADNLSGSDALSIVETLAEAGINPSKALETSMTDLGFDAKNIGELANDSSLGNRPPPPPPPSSQGTEETSSMVDYLDELLKEKLASTNTELTDEDKQSILAQVFEKYGVGEENSIINTSA